MGLPLEGIRILELGQIILEGNAKELINDEKVKRAYLGSTHEERGMG